MWKKHSLGLRERKESNNEALTTGVKRRLALACNSWLAVLEPWTSAASSNRPILPSKTTSTPPNLPYIFQSANSSAFIQRTLSLIVSFFFLPVVALSFFGLIAMPPPPPQVSRRLSGPQEVGMVAKGTVRNPMSPRGSRLIVLH